jgi:hypothetical protein
VSALATGSLLFITVMILIDIILNQLIKGYQYRYRYIPAKCTGTVRRVSTLATGSLLSITVMILIDIILN